MANDDKAIKYLLLILYMQDFLKNEIQLTYNIVLGVQHNDLICIEK